MKKFLTLSAAVLSACVVSPLVGKASLPAQQTNDPAVASARIVKATAADDNRVTYVIMRSSGTGSSIPTVYRIYRGRVTASASRNGSTYADLSPAGSESVAGSLVRLDPSISTSLHR